MKRIALFVLSLAMLSGCAMSQTLAHPDGRQEKCKIYYWGVGGVIISALWMADCINSHESRGFKQIEGRDN